MNNETFVEPQPVPEDKPKRAYQYSDPPLPPGLCMIGGAIAGGAAYVLSVCAAFSGGISIVSHLGPGTGVIANKILGFFFDTIPFWCFLVPFLMFRLWRKSNKDFVRGIWLGGILGLLLVVRVLWDYMHSWPAV